MKTSERWRRFGLGWLAVLGLAGGSGRAQPQPAVPTVELENKVYSYVDPQNGAGPMWCSGSSCLVRLGDRVIASGLETVAGVPPLNNCRWLLFELAPGATNWSRVNASPAGLTREPCPIAIANDGRVFLSMNTTNQQTALPRFRPDLYEFVAENLAAPWRSLKPEWRGRPDFTEHSYRSLASDPETGEVILFQNAGNWSVFWTFRDRHGVWSAGGELRWPWGADYATPQPVRICYPNVLLRDREVHFCGVSDIVEPNPEWRAFKRQLTGREWDYDFRRLFYTWSSDITAGQFENWIEIASRDRTCGWISPGDLWLGPGDVVHLVWYERAIDERLRERFFPEARQSHAINYARLRKGELLMRRSLVSAEEGQSREIPTMPRFQVTPENQLFVVYYVSGTDTAGNAVSENRLLEIQADGTPSAAVRIPLRHPMNNYFTATPRAGSSPSRILDLLGQRVGSPLTISYARVRLN